VGFNLHLGIPVTNSTLFFSMHTNTVVRKMYADGRAEQCYEEWTLQQMQEFVGGYLEAVATIYGSDFIMLINEDGIRLELPHNPLATEIAAPGTIMLGGIRGNALLIEAEKPDVDPPEEDEETFQD